MAWLGGGDYLDGGNYLGGGVGTDEPPTDPPPPPATEIRETIDEKHGTLIAVGYEYTNEEGVDVWEKFIVPFDIDLIANVWAISCAFGNDGAVIPTFTADADTVRIYYTIGVGSAPPDPTKASASIAGRQGSATGTGSYAKRSDQVYVKARGEDKNGVLGPVKEDRFSRGAYIPPTFQITFSRSSSTVTMTIVGSDPSAAMSAFSFSYNYPDGSGGYNSVADSTAWDAGATNWSGPGDTNFRNTLTLTVPLGVGGEISFKALYTDENGVTRSKGEAFSLKNIDQTTKKLIVDHLKMFDTDNNYDFERGDTYYYSRQSGQVHRASALPIPVGATIVNFRARMYADDSGASTTARLRRVSSSDVVSDVSSILSWSNEGVSWKSDAVSQAVAEEELYQVVIQLSFSLSLYSTARFYRAEITYDVPTMAITV